MTDDVAHDGARRFLECRSLEEAWIEFVDDVEDVSGWPAGAKELLHEAFIHGAMASLNMVQEGRTDQLLLEISAQGREDES